MRHGLAIPAAALAGVGCGSSNDAPPDAPRGRLGLAVVRGNRQAGTPAGRMPTLDLEGSATQRPRTLSGGWNNPCAFAYLPGGALWVADDAPGKRPERLARGDAAAEATALDGRPAASGLAALGSRTLALCGMVRGTLGRYERDATGRWRYAGTIARGCRYGVVRLTDRRRGFSAGDGIVTIRP